MAAPRTPSSQAPISQSAGSYTGKSRPQAAARRTEATAPTPQIGPHRQTLLGRCSLFLVPLEAVIDLCHPGNGRPVAPGRIPHVLEADLQRPDTSVSSSALCQTKRKTIATTTIKSETPIQRHVIFSFDPSAPRLRRRRERFRQSERRARKIPKAR
jgi:hypothetical protein